MSLERPTQEKLEDIYAFSQAIAKQKEPYQLATLTKNQNVIDDIATGLVTMLHQMEVAADDPVLQSAITPEQQTWLQEVITLSKQQVNEETLNIAIAAGLKKDKIAILTAAVTDYETRNPTHKARCDEITAILKTKAPFKEIEEKLHSWVEKNTPSSFKSMFNKNPVGKPLHATIEEALVTARLISDATIRDKYTMGRKGPG